jgi:hypothetical protein
LAAPLTPLCGTLVCRGTPVGNHWVRVRALSLFRLGLSCFTKKTFFAGSTMMHLYLKFLLVFFHASQHYD